ncbi:precorrin-8X methylmutase [Thiocapsa imhoffii]|uniref:Precorrin-8X methylmutase n=1 Tax=Thiocapsa imhoffii TaxID=382777 RepID=A0A9X0WJB5_9GAMM|nr:precorrin-8X methylmutase [Thiocapsa imhoffii]MBK1645598.1 precorrin-8X methylmutase [Thiocapsa imhoffii]
MTIATEADGGALLTRGGAAIENASFAIIDAEAAPHAYDDDQWSLVRRLIHASGDFDFNGLTRFHPAAIGAGVAAVRRGCPIVCDVEMVRAGLSRVRLAEFGLVAHQSIDQPEVIAAARVEETTRAVQAMRLAHRQGLLDGAVVGIGNAPTALLELIRLVRDADARPALIVGMPVGFVAAAESKEQLGELDAIPWILVTGRKGGSTLVVAALHALMILAARQPPSHG